jgi:hypothetical protein
VDVDYADEFVEAELAGRARGTRKQRRLTLTIVSVLLACAFLLTKMTTARQRLLPPANLSHPGLLGHLTQGLNLPGAAVTMAVLMALLACLLPLNLIGRWRGKSVQR